MDAPLGPHVHAVQIVLGSLGAWIGTTAIALSNAPAPDGVLVAVVARTAIAVANLAFSRR